MGVPGSERQVGEIGASPINVKSCLRICQMAEFHAAFLKGKRLPGRGASFSIGRILGVVSRILS